MKKFIRSASNTSNIFTNPDVIESADDDMTEEEANTLEDKIKSAEDDFDFIISGLDQLDSVQANSILNEIHDTLQDFIQQIAGELA